MGNPFILNDDIPVQYCIRCRICKTPVALEEDCIGPGPDIRVGIIHKMFNIDVPDGVKYHTETQNGSTLSDAYCIQCGMLLGWKIIEVHKPSRKYSVGRFVMKSKWLIYWNDVTVFQANYQVPDNQVGGANDQDGGANDQVGGANDQDGGANEQAPNEQDLGINQQNADQDEGANEQNADQAGGANAQGEGANEQDLGDNEQNADQDEDANEHNDDEGGGAPMN